MSKSGQNYLLENIRKSIEYCAREYEMTWVEVIGCLEMTKCYYAEIAFGDGLEEEGDEGNQED